MVAALDAIKTTFHWAAATATGYELRDHVRVEFAPNSGEVLGFEAEGERIKGLSFEGMGFAKTR